MHFAWTTCCSNEQSQAKCFPWDGECTMLMHVPKALRARWFEKSTDVFPQVRNGSRSPQWCAVRWRRQGTVRQCFVNSTEVVFAAILPCSTIEVTCNHVNLSETMRARMSFLGMPFFFGVNVADMKRESTVMYFCPLPGDRRNEARKRTPCKTHPCSPSMT